MGEHQQQVAKRYQRMDFDELADAPLEALGLGSSDAAALKQALGILRASPLPRVQGG